MAGRGLTQLKFLGRTGDTSVTDQDFQRSQEIEIDAGESGVIRPVHAGYVHHVIAPQAVLTHDKSRMAAKSVSPPSLAPLLRRRRRSLGVALGLACLGAGLAGAFALKAEQAAASAPLHELGGSQSGFVTERLSAGSYTYLHVRRSTGSMDWIVVLGRAPEVGSAVNFEVFAVKQDFRSKRLQRVFPELGFARLVESN